MPQNLASSPAGELVFAIPTNNATLSRQARAGAALRLTKGIYVVGGTLPPEALAQMHRLAIVAHEWPDAVVCGTSALHGGEPVDGWLFVTHPGEGGRVRDLSLPGLTVRAKAGPKPLPGDVRLPAGVYLSGAARQLVESVTVRGRPASHQAGIAVVEERIDELARQGGPGRVRQVLDQLEVIAVHFDPSAVAAIRVRLAAVLGTVENKFRPVTQRLAARLAGSPLDAHRLELLQEVVGTLARRAPRLVTAHASDPRWSWLPFFEAYFSNFIEGTRWPVEEARAIAIEDVTPEARPADAHDVRATYHLAADPADRQWVPRTGDEMLDGLVRRHRVLMAARPEKRPGEFKEKPNYAGGYRFVDPEAVRGTLLEGFNVMNELVDPFARAVAMMVLLTECHPFDDGNGRVARLCSNAELSSAGQVRLVVPTVYRSDYLGGLNAMSNRAGQGQPLVAVLDFAQRWTAAVDWSTFDHAHKQIYQCNAYEEPAAAEASQARLTMPPRYGDDAATS